MMNRADKAWLAIGMDAWLLGAEASMVMALRGMKVAQGGAAAWRETQRMFAEKSEANVALAVALASGQLGMNPETIAKGTINHYRKHVRANRRMLAGG